MSVRVLIVDDSAYVRKVVSQMLSRAADIEVVGEAESADRAVFETIANRPFSRPSTRYISQSGRSRSSGRLMIRATSSLS